MFPTHSLITDGPTVGALKDTDSPSNSLTQQDEKNQLYIIYRLLLQVKISQLVKTIISFI